MTKASGEVGNGPEPPHLFFFFTAGGMAGFAFLRLNANQVEPLVTKCVTGKDMHCLCTVAHLRA